MNTSYCQTCQCNTAGYEVRAGGTIAGDKWYDKWRCYICKDLSCLNAKPPTVLSGSYDFVTDFAGTVPQTLAPEVVAATPEALPSPPEPSRATRLTEHKAQIAAHQEAIEALGGEWIDSAGDVWHIDEDGHLCYGYEDGGPIVLRVDLPAFVAWLTKEINYE